MGLDLHVVNDLVLYLLETLDPFVHFLDVLVVCLLKVFTLISHHFRQQIVRKPLNRDKEINQAHMIRDVNIKVWLSNTGGHE